MPAAAMVTEPGSPATLTQGEKHGTEIHHKADASGYHTVALSSGAAGGVYQQARVTSRV